MFVKQWTHHINILLFQSFNVFLNISDMGTMNFNLHKSQSCLTNTQRQKPLWRWIRTFHKIRRWCFQRLYGDHVLQDLSFTKIIFLPPYEAIYCQQFQFQWFYQDFELHFKKNEINWLSTHVGIISKLENFSRFFTIFHVISRSRQIITVYLSVVTAIKYLK